MAEWLYEAGIGECRAALVSDGRIVEAQIERDESGARAGAVCDARLTRLLIPGRRGIMTLEGGEEALIEPIPAGLSEGAAARIVVVRERIPEPGRAKLATVRPAPPGATPAPGHDLLARITISGHPVARLQPFGPDRLEQAGWSELIEEAASGDSGFDGGSLRIFVTPAMTLIDVDGAGDASALAVAGAAAAARAIVRLGIGGSIGIDLPTVPDRARRQAADAAIDAVLPQPFERTAVNGFGFVQIVRRRTRASLIETVQGDPVLTAALALLRRAERTDGPGERVLVAAPAIVARIEAQPHWIETLSRRAGAPVALRAEPGRPISAAYVETRPLR
ncbi:MAG: ribonuclease [Sphingomonas sp. SCN 67-18]|uniref:ribonuclease n=1 Tax=uncultured Sphingomonas sp. TaxID=158754 RepID=UPI000868905B|nr:ribonuclease [Sphingomonas sp. SCN 67-18]ODU21129.1 MAG: ribonuclease [Sphingomonas sp. SCN 67-18]